MPQNYPFTKSRYFKKKRMRSADFVRDQAYVENKIALLSQTALGEGIALGLGVQRIDSDAILVEPGLAIDGLGRFLVVDEPAVCRVRTLSGFDTLTGETAHLWLSYHEELFDPMFVADSGSEAAEYAGIRERFSFYLTDKRCVPPTAAEQALFFETVLFEDDELCVRQIVPRILSSTWRTQLRLVIDSCSSESLELDICYAPVIPGFSGEDQKEPRLEQHLSVEKGETVLSLTIIPKMAGQSVSISLPESGFSLIKRGVRMESLQAFREECQVVAGNPVEKLEPQLTAQSLRDLLEEETQGVLIASVRFVRCEDKFLLDDVIPAGRRFTVPYLKEQLHRCAACYIPSPEDSAQEDTTQTEDPGEPDKPQSEQSKMTTGTVVLSTGMHKRAGDLLQTDEIAHGLGLGTVYIEFGIENVYPAVNVDQNRTDLLLGDVSLFEQASGTYDCTFDRGVRIHPDKGTFELALRPHGELRQSSVRLRWFAWRPDELVERKVNTGSLIRLVPDVITVEPGAAITFAPVFSGGTGLLCDFFVEGKHAGVITQDGVYTAPDKPGLYQVYAQTKGRVEERAHGFVLVKEAEDGSGGV